jgi:hypothetical protein
LPGRVIIWRDCRLQHRRILFETVLKGPQRVTSGQDTRSFALGDSAAAYTVGWEVVEFLHGLPQPTETGKSCSLFEMAVDCSIADVLVRHESGVEHTRCTPGAARARTSIAPWRMTVPAECLHGRCRSFLRRKYCLSLSRTVDCSIAEWSSKGDSRFPMSVGCVTVHDGKRQSQSDHGWMLRRCKPTISRIFPKRKATCVVLHAVDCNNRRLCKCASYQQASLAYSCPATIM